MEFSHPVIWLIASASIFSRYLLFAGIAFFIFYIAYKKRWSLARIQDRFPKNKDYRREILYSLCSVGIFASIALIIRFSPLAAYTKIYTDIETYSMGYYVLTLGLMLVLHDTYFYWTHRLLHHRKLFKWTHLVHHQSHNPSPWAAYAFHPIEGVVEAGILVVIAFAFPVHTSALMLFFTFSISFNVLGHLGYELFPKGMNKHWLGQWINTSTNHNMHHKYNRGNYGLYFTFWDKMMGTTDKKYDETFERITTKRDAEKVSAHPQKAII